MPSAGPSSASRQTVMSGGTVQLACRAVRDELLARVRRQHGWTGGAPELAVAGGTVWAGGVPVGPVGDYLDPPIEATRIHHHRRTQPPDDRGQGDIHVAFGFAAHRAVVEVDGELGLARVVQVAAAHDVGRAVNPQGVTGQIEGGTAQGLGLAMMEEVRLREGRILNPSFTDYLIPTIMDVPEVVTEVVEHPEPGLPFGAKGVAEHSTIVAPAAIVAALREATGRELNRVPVLPEDLAGLRPPVASPGPPHSPAVPGPRPIPEYHGLVSGREVPLEG